MPVLSTYHADIPEVVLHGVTGLLVPERDIDALAQNIEYLVRHPECWEELGRNGREHIEKEYNIVKQVERLEEIYHSALCS